MVQPEIAVVLNPAAGGGRALKALPKVHAALEAHGAPYAIHVTEECGDATRQARAFAEEGARLLLAVGGDGTMHEVANGLHGTGGSTALGVVPVGHGRDLARTLGASTKVEEAVRAACAATPRPIDLGCVRYEDGSERIFINIAGLGFDAMVAEGAQRSRLPGSNLPYLATALRTLVKFENVPVTIESDEATFSLRSVFVQVANAQYMGGGYHFAPMAEIDDGLLNVCVVGDFGKLELVRQIPKVYRGGHVGHPKFRHFRTRCVRISSATPAKLQLDGELLGTTPVTFSVVPAGLVLAL